LSNYVSCSLEPPYGMIQSDIGRTVVVLCRISPHVIWEEGTLFCAAWSSYRQFSLDYLLEHSTASDFDQMFPNRDSSEPRFLGAEILPRERVWLGDIGTVYFTDSDSRQLALTECRRVIDRKGKIGATVSFVVRPEVFKRPPDLYSRRSRYAQET